MILRSELGAVSGDDVIPSESGDVHQAVMRLEFKAIDPSRPAEFGGLLVDQTPVETISQVEEMDQSRLEDERQRSEQLDAARRAGREEGREEVEAECERRIAEERTEVLRLAQAFQREREKYFSAVESEVVKLALAIAARVLHREARLDPVMLQAAVKVALERVREESGAVLHVPMNDLQIWRELTLRDELGAIEVTGDPRLELGECVLDTRVGRVELGVGAQLQEIERGFFDLLQQRPGY